MNCPQPVLILIVCLALIFIIRQISVILKKKFIRLITTPLITYFICGIAAVGVYRYGSGYDWMILAALGLSLIADSVLMIENKDLFAHGLIFFLGTHILYIIVFSEWYRFIWSDMASGLSLLALMAFLVYKFYKAGKLGTMMIPVIVYITALSLIVFFSVNGAFRNGDTVSYLRMCGAVLFYISDAILGWTQFVKYYRFTTLYVWFFYAPGQLLIALSLFY
jgi:uncharacterized membrane protein YhhN